MDDVKKLILQSEREKIVTDLDVSLIIDELYQTKTINETDYEIILKEKTKTHQARRLLDILTTRGNDAYDNFVNSLRKDYAWLWNDLQLNSNSEGIVNTYEERLYYDAINLGDLPRHPPHYVPRSHDLKELKTVLRKLQRGKYVVLHGMTGSGKSCLASAAVSDRQILNECFKNRVYWINVGESPTDSDLVLHLIRLYQKLDYIDDDNNKRSNRQSMTVTDSLDLVRDTLKVAFTKEQFRDVLLILDDVNSMDVIRAFNLGCKILVTTQDMKVVPKADSYFIEVKGGFTEIETLTLFSDCIRVPINELPHQAKKIHSLCKGGPMLIALIGSLLEEKREDVIANPGRWNYYIDQLTNKQYELENNGQLFSAIGMRVENLSDELKEYYKYFALFVEDINIMPEVLQTIWKLNKYKVEDIMTDLKNKSLVVSIYNKYLKSYVYGIHDLLLAYLKKQLTNEDKIELHRKLISCYSETCNNNFANLPDDNYIYSYIGYHLYEGEMWSDFGKIYFDLNFIGAKLKMVGSADLVADFKRYRSPITNNNPDLVEKLDELQKFVLTHGQDLHKYQHTDIIQCALKQSKSTNIYQQALDIATKSRDRLYFHFLFEQEGVHNKSTLDLSEDVFTARFTNDINRVLIGTESGQINLWDQSYNSLLYTFHGHSGPITSLALHPVSKDFLSTSKDGTVKLWSLEGIPCINSNGNVFDENGFADKTPSPRIRQPNWSNFYENEEARDRSRVTLRLPNDSLTCAAFAHERDDVAASGSENGSVVIWNINTVQIKVQIQIKSAISCCTFSLDDQILLFGSEHELMFCYAKNGDMLYLLDNKSRLISLLIVPTQENKIVAVSDDSIKVWSWNYDQTEIDFPMTDLSGQFAISDLSGQILNSCKSTRYTSGAVTVDGKYVVAGATNYTIRMWDIDTGNLVKEILDHNGLVQCLDTYLRESPDHPTHFVLSASDDKTVKQWYIRPTDFESMPTRKLKEVFSACWKDNSNDAIPMMATVDTENKIQVRHGLTVKSETEEMKSCVTTLVFSPCATKIAFGCDDGFVREFIMENKKCDLVMHLDSSVIYLEYLKHDVLVASSVNSSLMVRHRGENSKLQLDYLNYSNECSNFVSERLYSQSSPVMHHPTIKCFLLDDGRKMISVGKDRSVKCWNLRNRTLENVLAASSPKNVTMAAMNSNQDYLAIVQDDGYFHIYKIVSKTLDDGMVAIDSQYSQGSNLESSIRSCAFSPDGKLLAIGQDSGKITLWNLECKMILSVLELHRAPVRQLVFGPPRIPLILMSVGEQLAWWNVTLIQQNGEAKLKRRSRGSGRFKVTKRSSKGDVRFEFMLENLELANSNSNTLEASELWQGKTGPDKNTPELLASIKLRGTYATHICSSADFTAFATLDDYGLIYIMNVLK